MLNLLNEETILLPGLQMSHLSHNAAHSNDGSFGCSASSQGLSDSLRDQEGALGKTQEDRRQDAHVGCFIT